MTDEIIDTLAAFKTYVQGIEFDENLDANLGTANVLLFACRQEIDKVWATERNAKAKSSMARSTAMGVALLEKLGLMKSGPMRRL